MNYATHLQLPDMQKTPDTRGVQIDQVGICDLTYPIVVLDRDNQRQQATATIAVSVSLPHHFKGTHMSRFLEVLAAHQGEITMRTLPVILGELKKRLAAESARLEVEFTYFLQKKAPVSGLSAPMDYRCTFVGESGADGDRFEMKVKVPVSTLCPCSKVISDYGAHNQRGYVTMAVRPKREADGGGWKMVWIEELIEVAERSASAPIYPLLKRVDERHVTMQAYDNPVFVEDVVRNVAVNLESIHNHSAFAVVTHSA